MTSSIKGTIAFGGIIHSVQLFDYNLSKLCFVIKMV